MVGGGSSYSSHAASVLKSLRPRVGVLVVARRNRSILTFFLRLSFNLVCVRVIHVRLRVRPQLARSLRRSAKAFGNPDFVSQRVYSDLAFEGPPGKCLHACLYCFQRRPTPTTRAPNLEDSPGGVLIE